MSTMTLPRAPLISLLREHTAIWAVACLGVLLSGTGLWVVEQQLRTQRGMEFEWVADERINAFHQGVLGALAGVETVGDFLRATPRATGQEIRTFTDGVTARFAGINALWWLPEGTTGSMAERPFDGPEGDRPIFAAGTSFPSAATAASLIGQPGHAVWLGRARERNALTLSDPFLEPGKETHAVLAYLPVTEPTDRGGGAPGGSVRGMVVALLDLEQIASLAVSVLAPRGVEFTVRDESAPPGRQLLELYTSRLHGSTTSTRGADPGLDVGQSDRYVREIEIGDRRWSVICTPIEGFRSAIIFQRGHWLVLGSGLLLTLLVAAYLLHNKQRLLERLGMEQALQEREELFWQMTETVENMFFWAVDSQRYDFLYISPAFEKIWGIPCERVHVSSNYYRDAIHPLDREHRDDVLVAARRGKRGAESTYRVRRPDGAIRWVSDSAYPVQDAAGRVFRIVGVTKDVTEQRLAEQALRRSEASLRDLFNRSPDVLATVDTAGLILMLSRSLPGLSTEQAKGRDSAVLLPPEWRDWYRGHLQELFRSRRPQHFRYFAEGGTWWEVRMVSVRQDQGVDTALVIASDVTEYHHLQEQMLHSARLASLGALAAGVAHEINNPNNAIQFGADLLQRVWRDVAPVLDSFVREQGDFSLGGLSYQAEREAVGRVVTDIRHNSERIRCIVDNLKHLVRKETGDMNSRVDLRQVLEEVQMILHNKIRKHTDAFAMDVPLGLPEVQGNAQQLEQLFMNLVLNALESLPSRDARVQVIARSTDDGAGVEVEVRDEGSGVRPEDMSRLTQPFFSTKTANGGTGLGLSIAAEIVERHGGELRFNPNPDGGTRARVLIPLTRSA